VVVNLALFFGYHVLMPQGLSGRFDGVAAVIAVLAAVALFKFKRNVIHVIAASAMLGLLVSAIR
jgi:chromate transporter